MPFLFDARTRTEKTRSEVVKGISHAACLIDPMSLVVSPPVTPPPPPIVTSAKEEEVEEVEEAAEEVEEGEAAEAAEDEGEVEVSRAEDDAAAATEGNTTLDGTGAQVQGPTPPLLRWHVIASHWYWVMGTPPDDTGGRNCTVAVPFTVGVAAATTVSSRSEGMSGTVAVSVVAQTMEDHVPRPMVLTAATRKQYGVLALSCCAVYLWRNPEAERSRNV